MKRIIYLIQKEFLQIFRDRLMVRLIFLMPVVQLFVLAYAASFNIRNIRIHIIDQDQSQTSQKFISQLDGSPYFLISGWSFDDDTGYAMVARDRADLILKIPPGFERDISRLYSAQVQILINAINGTKARLANAYLNVMIGEFSMSPEYQTALPMKGGHPTITIDHRNWYNPAGDYKIFMVPGILVALVTLLSMFLSALNIVREKELGTIEQLNVTTIGKFEFIIGKLVPFAILALVVLSLGLIVASIFFQVPVKGSLLLLYGYACLYILSAMGIGIFISNISKSQQQAMFTSFFFMIIFILMSGLFTPIESMPDWAQAITLFNPLSYFIEFMRLILLKGSTFDEVRHLFVAIVVYAICANILALLTYRKIRA